MRHRQGLQLGRSLRSELEQDLAVILRVRLTLEEAGGFHPVDQLDGGVMTQGETIRQLGNRPFGARREAFNRKQSLMLLGLNPMFSCSYLAELEKMPELVSKLSQLTIIVHRKIHKSIVTRYIEQDRRIRTMAP